MSLYHIMTHDRGSQAVLVLADDFTTDHWDAARSDCRDRIKDGLRNWDVDLRRLQFIGSQFLGQLVEFNSMVNREGGHLRLVLKAKTPVCQVIEMARLNRVIPVCMS